MLKAKEYKKLKKHEEPRAKNMTVLAATDTSSSILNNDSTIIAGSQLNSALGYSLIGTDKSSVVSASKDTL